MIKPQPYELNCTKCGWSKTFAPASDVLLSGQEVTNHCLKCGNTELKHNTLGPIRGLITQISAQLKTK